MTYNYLEIKEAVKYVESQLARRAQEVGGIDILAQQAGDRFLTRLYNGVDQKDCKWELYRPKNLKEVKERAEASASRFIKMFGEVQK